MKTSNRLLQMIFAANKLYPFIDPSYNNSKTNHILGLNYSYIDQINESMTSI